MSFSEEKSNSRYEFAKKIQGESDSETSKSKEKIDNKNSIEDETKIIKFKNNSELNNVSPNLFKNDNQIGKNFDKNLNANEKKCFSAPRKKISMKIYDNFGISIPGLTSIQNKSNFCKRIIFIILYSIYRL